MAKIEKDPATANSAIKNLLQGDRTALAQAVTALENDYPNNSSILAAIANKTGKSHVIGFTGAPGVGKSTLIDACIPVIRARNKTVAILAIDPSSVISGGAILGDRIRMTSHSNDDGVFIRSVATRGQLGGLSPTALNIVNLFDATGWDIVIVETVGTGQSEIDISRIADTTVVVESPGLGDEVQALKAGLLEVADILVVNKDDLDNSASLASNLTQSVSLRQNSNKPMVLKTIATSSKGIENLIDAIESHHKSVNESRQQDSMRLRTRNYTARTIGAMVEAEFLNSDSAQINELCFRLQNGEIDIQEVVQKLAHEFGAHRQKQTDLSD